MKKRIIIAAGGTGGHLFPALALAKELTSRFKDLDLKFLGKGLSKHPAFDQFKVHEIASGTLNPKRPIKALKSALEITQGIQEASSIINAESPDLVLGFGSFYTLPTLIAARLKKVPLILHEQNSIPGRVNRFLSPLAKITAIQFPMAKERLKGCSCEVRWLIREAHFAATREEAFRYFALDPERKTLLVAGGSQGAKSINDQFVEAAAHLGPVQVIHLVGKGAETIEEAYRKKGIVARVKNFEERMDFAWLAADLFVGRSGAGTVAEALHYRVPSIFIPFPFATDAHQEVNARFVEALGGAMCLKEEEASPSVLAFLVNFSLQQERFEAMKSALDAYHLRPLPPSMGDLVGDHLYG